MIPSAEQKKEMRKVVKEGKRLGWTFLEPTKSGRAIVAYRIGLPDDSVFEVGAATNAGDAIKTIVTAYAKAATIEYRRRADRRLRRDKPDIHERVELAEAAIAAAGHQPVRRYSRQSSSTYVSWYSPEYRELLGWLRVSDHLTPLWQMGHDAPGEQHLMADEPLDDVRRKVEAQIERGRERELRMAQGDYSY